MKMIPTEAFDFFRSSGLTGLAVPETTEAVEDWLIDCHILPCDVVREVQCLIGTIGLPTDQVSADILASLAAIA